LVFAFEFLTRWPFATARPPKFGKSVKNHLYPRLRSTPSSGASKLFFGRGVHEKSMA